MAQYKVPQDVEADDKLLGPFNFRQFIYLLVVAGLVALAWALAQIFPVLAILPAPFIFFLLLLALPLRKDQPMETYITALISFYTKPNKRFFNPGQRESTIDIVAPKIVEDTSRTRNISGEEASHRLSFLANVVDSEGYSIKGDFPPASESPLRDDIFNEAISQTDIYDNYRSTQISQEMIEEQNRHHTEVVNQMRAAIEANNPIHPPEPHVLTPPVPPKPTIKMSTPEPAPQSTTPQQQALQNLANNEAYSMATIQQEAARVTKPKPKDKDGEVYVKLH